MMTIQIGESIPSAALSQMAENGPQTVSTVDYFAGRKVVLFSVFVMHAWGNSANAKGIDMLADGNGDFSKALGLAMDASAFGMGQRSQRFALVADDGIVTHLMIEAPGEFRVSSAESVLAAL
jgi:peroxiredoxin